MDKQRFVAFRIDLAKLRDLVKKNQSSQYVENVFSELVKTYPELAADEKDLPNLKVEPNATSGQEVKKSDTDVKEKLIKSMDDTRFVDYTDFNPMLDNEETCLHSLTELERAIQDSRKRIIYFSSLQGQVLNRLRQITGKKLSQLLKLTPYSQSQAYFLIHLYELSQKHDKIIYSNLPLRFFKNNFKTIASICDSEPELFSLN